jgi:hypothetical protein
MARIDNDCSSFTIDDVPVILDNLAEFIAPFVGAKDEFPMPRISMKLCNLHEYTKNTFMCMTLLINLDDIADYSLRVTEGAYCATNKCIIDTDGFIVIKTDSDSVHSAIRDIHAHTIPLHNIYQSIDFDAFPYVVRED